MQNNYMWHDCQLDVLITSQQWVTGNKRLHLINKMINRRLQQLLPYHELRRALFVDWNSVTWHQQIRLSHDDIIVWQLTIKHLTLTFTRPISDKLLLGYSVVRLVQYGNHQLCISKSFLKYTNNVLIKIFTHKNCTFHVKIMSYDTVYLKCSNKLTDSQLSLPHRYVVLSLKGHSST